MRLLAFSCQTAVVLIHGCLIPAGLRLQNLLGVLKIGILLITVGTGAAALLATFKKAFRARTTLIRGKQYGKVPEEAGASSVHVYTMQAISLPFNSSRNLLLQVIWSYTGFSIVNSALPEVQNPARTVWIAGPLLCRFTSCATSSTSLLQVRRKSLVLVACGFSTVQERLGLEDGALVVWLCGSVGFGEHSYRSVYQLSYYDLPADLRSEFSRLRREGSIKRSQQRVSSHSARCGLQTRPMELHWHPQLTSYFSPLDSAVHICLMP